MKETAVILACCLVMATAALALFAFVMQL